MTVIEPMPGSNKDPVAIRPANAREGRHLGELALRSKAYWGYSPEFIEACRAELSVSDGDLSNPDRSYFVAEQAGRIVGFCALERVSPGEVELEALFVEPDRIGQGIGRLLIEHAKSAARARGAESILIQGDPNAARFYEAAGAEYVGERESGSIPGRFLPEYRIVLGGRSST